MKNRNSVFKEYIIEADAYWINPQGLFMPVDTKHILKVIDNPNVFGLTLADIQKVYDEESEKLGVEGRAREKIILDLIGRGFIRIRYYPRYGRWTVNCNCLSDTVKSWLQQWASSMIGFGVSRFDEVNLDLPVKKKLIPMEKLLLDQYEQQIKEIRAKIGELVLELDARKKLQALLDQEETDYLMHFSELLW